MKDSKQLLSSKKYPSKEECLGLIKKYKEEHGIKMPDEEMLNHYLDVVLGERKLNSIKKANPNKRDANGILITKLSQISEEKFEDALNNKKVVVVGEVFKKGDLTLLKTLKRLEKRILDEDCWNSNVVYKELDGVKSEVILSFVKKVGLN